MLKINNIDFPELAVISFNELLVPRYQVDMVPKMADELTEEDLQLTLQLTVHTAPVDKDGVATAMQKLLTIGAVTDIEINEIYHTQSYKRIHKAEMYSGTEIERLEDTALTLVFNSME